MRIVNDTDKKHMVTVMKTATGLAAWTESNAFFEIKRGGSESWDRNPSNGNVTICFKPATTTGAIFDATCATVLTNAGFDGDLDLVRQAGCTMVNLPVGDYTITELIAASKRRR